MKYLTTLALAATTLLFSCSPEGNSASIADQDSDANASNQDTDQIAMAYYGEEITPEGAISIQDLMGKVEVGQNIKAKVKAPISMTCRKMGCWMDVKIDEDREMKVYMHDHSFFVPKTGADGLMSIIDGEAYYDTLSVDFLKHLAEDAEASQEEIDAITEPQFELAFDATGVIIMGDIVEEGSEEDHDHDHGHEGEGDHEH